MKEIVKYSGCIVCGDKNEIGLQARFYWDGNRAVSDITATEAYAGYRHIFHGGITSTMLDEIMIKALLAEELFVVTAEMSVRFKKPIFSGDSLHFEGWKTGQKGPLYLTEARVTNQHGDIVAEATGKYVRPGDELAARLRDSLE